MFSPRLLTACLALSTLTACTSIDCPLDNQVLMMAKFYDAATQKPIKVAQTLSIYGLKNQTEELLFNQGTGMESVLIPLNPASDCDTLLFKFADGNNSSTERVVIQHTRQPHFESMDCPAVTFHVLETVNHQPHELGHFPIAISQITVAQPQVQYEDLENLKIYLRTSAQ